MKLALNHAATKQSAEGGLGTVKRLNNQNQSGSPPFPLKVVASGHFGFAVPIFLSLIFLSALLNSPRNRQKNGGQKDEGHDA